MSEPEFKIHVKDIIAKMLNNGSSWQDLERLFDETIKEFKG